MYFDLMIDNNGELELKETFKSKKQAFDRAVQLANSGALRNKAVVIDKRINLDDGGVCVFYQEFYEEEQPKVKITNDQAADLKFYIAQEAVIEFCRQEGIDRPDEFSPISAEIDIEPILNDCGIEIIEE